MELIKLSKRLLTVANMVTKGSVVADIGTDHGYLPIYLVQNNISEHVIAMDVNKGPLNKALLNIGQLHLENKIDIRLSDGLDNLEKDEANTVTICGMGGKLIAKILECGKNKISQDIELILSPQSEIQLFREYLLQNGYRIVKEDMIIDDGKFYVIIKCFLNIEIRKSETVLCKTNQIEANQIEANQIESIQVETNQIEVNKVETNQVEVKYGKYLLEHKNDILKQYLMREQKGFLKIRENVDKCNSELAEERIKEIDYELSCIKEGLNYYEM